MRVTLSLPSGSSLEYTVEQGCTLNQLRGMIEDTEGIPEEMQNIMALSTAKRGDWDSYCLPDLFPEDYDSEKDALKLKLLLGPLDGGVGKIDCCFCGCSCFHEGNCFAWLCGVGIGCVDEYKRIGCQLCCFNGKCCSLL